MSSRGWGSWTFAPVHAGKLFQPTFRFSTLYTWARNKNMHDGFNSRPSNLCSPAASSPNGGNVTAEMQEATQLHSTDTASFHSPCMPRNPPYMARVSGSQVPTGKPRVECQRCCEALNSAELHRVHEKVHDGLQGL